MAGFLRRKKQDSVPPPSAVRTPSPPVNNAPPPLFARFATTRPPVSQRVVSSPMALVSAPRRDQAPKMTNGGGPRDGVQQQQREDAKQTRYTPAYAQGNPSDPSNSAPASASNGNEHAYGTPAQNRNSTPPTRTQPLPATNPPPSPRRLSRVPAADKPLPTIQPQDYNRDPLGSTPPQSSLPANRRASTRGLPPQTSAAPQNRVHERVMGVPAQQPPFSPDPSPRKPTRAVSSASPGLSTRPPPPSNQPPSARPNAPPGSPQNPPRYPKEHPRQDLRHKLSDAGTGPPAIPVPTSVPRQGAPGQWVPDGGVPPAASTSYQDPDASFTLPTSKPSASVINSEPTPPLLPPESATNMGATISSFEVQSFHPGDSFKINTGLLPAQQITTNNYAKPKRKPSSPVRGKPLIFAAMATVEAPPSEKAEYDPYGNYSAYPTPPTEVVKMPPRYLKGEEEGPSDLGFSRTAMDSWQQQQQSRSEERRTPLMNGNTSLPHVNGGHHVNGGQTPRMNGNTQLPPQLPPQPQTPQRGPARSPSSNSLSSSSRHTLGSGSFDTHPSTPHAPRTLVKARPTTPQRKQSSALQQPPQRTSPVVEREREPAADMAQGLRASTLMLDDDPFAKVEGVQMLKPSARDETATPPPLPPPPLDLPPPPVASVADPDEQDPSTPRPEAGFDVAPPHHVMHTTPPQKAAIHTYHGNASAPPSPVTPEEYRYARSRRRGDHLEKAPPPAVAGIEVRETRMPGPFPLAAFVTNPQLLSALLVYLSFYDWCILSAVTKDIRMRLVQTAELREEALERYLRTVGYSRWAWSDADPLELSLLDLHDYMRGVCIPTHEYARAAETYVQSFNVPPAARDPAHLIVARNLTASTRAYSRIILRLRAQAEREARDSAASKAAHPPTAATRIPAYGYASSRSSPSRASSRAPSPNSSFSHGHSQHQLQARPSAGTAFRSPLFRVKRAPLLRVFVPSPDGDWLSDKSVVECEAELKRAGVLGLLRMGDVVWDVAVGDEGNVGRLVWDGSYLIDLDYKYSAVGDLPQYLPTLAFPPSYFHRVIRTGPSSTNPIVHMDISPWGQEIEANLQLLQDRVRTETPQGAYHNVVRWVHRSSFVIRAPAKPRMSTGRARPQSPRIPIPESSGLFVDPGWYGTIVVETEGTNEALADLQDRCPGAFPPRAGGPPTVVLKEAKDAKKVFKILREKSRPGEIWIRAVGPKERLF
ncbi:hypothetical protein B0H10DRAFT_2057288 [Mycena sp. CBHHK59/15]|nr:hypothetical protein B0H10DRAFT_2057288 [Mycena sp. CBHHK59/15]